MQANPSDTYKTIKAPTEGVFRDKGSKFIAYAYPLTSDEKVKEIITHLQKEHPKARHICFAYVLGAQQEIYRTNDDGEPAGSAGKPILNQLKSFGLTNVLVAVVRYFGGTLLGVPGLINAYKEATRNALIGAHIIEEYVMDEFEIIVDYQNLSWVLNKLKTLDAIIVKQNLTSRAEIIFKIRKSYTQSLVSLFQHQKNINLNFLKTA
jgi:uncharacterized YigZ family protein